jgi:hypothetical protein
MKDAISFISTIIHIVIENIGIGSMNKAMIMPQIPIVAEFLYNHTQTFGNGNYNISYFTNISFNNNRWIYFAIFVCVVIYIIIKKGDIAYKHIFNMYRKPSPISPQKSVNINIKYSESVIQALMNLIFINRTTNEHITNVHITELIVGDSCDRETNEKCKAVIEADGHDIKKGIRNKDLPMFVQNAFTSTKAVSFKLLVDETHQQIFGCQSVLITIRANEQKKNSEQETDEDVLLGVEFDGIQSRREQPNQRFEHAFESSILTDLIFRKTTEEE